MEKKGGGGDSVHASVGEIGGGVRRWSDRTGRRKGGGGGERYTITEVGRAEELRWSAGVGDVGSVEGAEGE